jgi:hypothetical protein
MVLSDAARKARFLDGTDALDACDAIEGYEYLDKIITIAQGTPEQIAQAPGSYTGQSLREIL